MVAQWRLVLTTAWMVVCLTAAHEVRALFSIETLWLLLAVAVLCVVLLYPNTFLWPQFFKNFKPFKRVRLPVALLAVACLTVTYAQARAWRRLHEVVQPSWVGKTLSVQGRIDSIPTRTPFGMRFLFKPSPSQQDAEVQTAVNEGTLPSQISTAWYEDDLPVTGAGALRVGQVWSLPLGLKPPHATQNPGVFDQERYWFANDVRGLATVRVNKDTRLDDYPNMLGMETTFWSALQNTRGWALHQLDVRLAGQDEAVTAVLKALTFGDQSGVSNAQWMLFQQTGVTHLVSISGVHITMLAMLVAWLTQTLWRRSLKLCAWMPSLYAAQWLGLVVALTYALLAGWALPAQRTVVMLAIWLWLSRLGVASSGVRVLCFALWGVLCFDPFAVLSISFWLSFGAVAWLILALNDHEQVGDLNPLQVEKQAEKKEAHKWLSVMGVQLAIGLALLPVTLYFFHQASLLGVAVNFIAIPLVSGVVTPLLLLACALGFGLGWTWPLVWAHALLSKGLMALSWLVEVIPNGLWTHTLKWWQVVVLAVLSIALVLAMRRQRWVWLSCCAAGVAVVLATPRLDTAIADGQVRVHVLDIGQGSAVLLQTAHHNWLYDAGPKYGEDSDAGVRVIVPYLREMGVEHLDGMVLSHNDADHTGGAGSVSRAVRVDRVLTSISPERITEMGVNISTVQLCLVGQAWTVDGVKFSILSPDQATVQNAELADNPKSCVLRVDVGSGALKSLLLTGDIDALQEAKLVVSPAGGVRDWHADVLLMPHHGSGGSSSAPFIEASSPRWAIAQSGYLNPFHHPHPLVWARYQAAGAVVSNTVDSGALRFCLGCVSSEADHWRESGRWYGWD
ncbi:ComE operon protein 3 [Ephemeroptericola cinctiostellae]|uniref:ComE operon protein 3 n=1 Tax=Ephemeroptericola cinctiostellae TaxID=2268024 RepID=A0A345DCK4_9BURK|nr:DNA internalization-related competence protein ComEC/Rec2 [Ephemeroptericola cinctiostellae]AXF86092.1 ComE operon protein 3 [Ephemeroptericola cinctiostellae]